MSQLVLERVRNNLSLLGLKGVLTNIGGILEETQKNPASYTDFLDRVLEEEISFRQDRRVQALLKMSAFPYLKSLAEFDFSFQPQAEEPVIRELASLSFLERKENIIFLGPPGVGKTHLAVAIGIAACQKGRKVYFTDMEKVISELKKGNEKKLWFYRKLPLLIIDEVGYFPLDRMESHLFFKLINHRYETGSVVLTSNKSFAEWGDIFGDSVIASAILDRLLHHATVINIRGASYRLKNKALILNQKDPDKKAEPNIA
jgi:DNA replication protein DnaC